MALEDGWDDIRPTLARWSLLYQGAVLMLFGVLGLMIFPMQMLRSTGVKGNMNNKELMTYRVCGLWVTAGGFVSGAAFFSGDAEMQQFVCAVFAVVNALEVGIKLDSVWRSKQCAAQ